MLLNKIQDLMALGIGISFEREMNQFGITLSKEGKEPQHVTLPFDHLSEKRMCDYINLMQDVIINGKEEKD